MRPAASRSSRPRFPESSWQLPWIHSLFGNAPAVATGVAAALKVKGRDDVRVVGQAGDGGTVDIGFACLSGMFERNDDVLFVCYDNEAYMNTGVQRSGATPPAARTANTKPVGPEPGNVFGPGQEPASDRDGTRDPLRRNRHRRGAARPRGKGRAGDRSCAGRDTSMSSSPARWAGARPRATRSGSRDWSRRPGSSPCSRPSTAIWSRSRRSADVFR